MSQSYEIESSLVGARRLFSMLKARWKSPEYRAAIRRWRGLCRFEIMKWREFESRKAAAFFWHQLYLLCPSGTPEEKVALALWQFFMPYDPDLMEYRRRVIREGDRAKKRFTSVAN